VYKPYFWQEYILQNLGPAYTRNIMYFFTTEPATPVLYVVKLPAKTASVWDCYLASYFTRANVPTHFDHMRVADTIDSQKSEDRDITDKLP
jgi:hypothetical protein